MVISGRGAVDKFVQRTLRNDGVFILRIVSSNAGDLITTDIVAALWKMYLEDEKNRQAHRPSLIGNAPKFDDENNHFNPDNQNFT